MRVSVSVDGPPSATATGSPGPGARRTTGSSAGSTTLRRARPRPSPRSAWSATRGRAWPRSCTSTSSTSAATSSASTSRSRRASTAAPTRTPARRCARSGRELVGGVAARPAHPRPRDRVDAAVRRRGARRHRRRACCPAELDPIPTVAIDGSVFAALAGAGRVQRSRGTATSQSGNVLRTPAGEILCAAAGGHRLGRRVPRAASKPAGPPARTSVSAAARTRRTATSSTAGFDGPRPTTAATARSAYWRECSTMPRTH